MNTILIFVSTLDGKVTKWGSPHASNHQLIIMTGHPDKYKRLEVFGKIERYLGLGVIW